MAAIDTYDWVVQRFLPNPDDATKKFLRDQREYLLSIRDENQRRRFVAGLVEEIREERVRRR